MSEYIHSGVAGKINRIVKPHIGNILVTSEFGNAKESTLTEATLKAVVNDINRIKYAVTYKGEKATVDALPTTGNTKGDMWNVAENGHNYAWTGSEWDDLGGNNTSLNENNNFNIWDGQLYITVLGGGYDTGEDESYYSPFEIIIPSTLLSTAWDQKIITTLNNVDSFITGNPPYYTIVVSGVPITSSELVNNDTANAPILKTNNNFINLKNVPYYTFSDSYRGYTNFNLTSYLQAGNKFILGTDIQSMYHTVSKKTLYYQSVDIDETGTFINYRNTYDNNFNLIFILSYDSTISKYILSWEYASRYNFEPHWILFKDYNLTTAFSYDDEEVNTLELDGAYDLFNGVVGIKGLIIDVTNVTHTVSEKYLTFLVNNSLYIHGPENMSHYTFIYNPLNGYGEITILGDNDPIHGNNQTTHSILLPETGSFIAPKLTSVKLTHNSLTTNTHIKIWVLN